MVVVIDDVIYENKSIEDLDLELNVQDISQIVIIKGFDATVFGIKGNESIIIHTK